MRGGTGAGKIGWDEEEMGVILGGGGQKEEVVRGSGKVRQG